MGLLGAGLLPWTRQGGSPQPTPALPSNPPLGSGRGRGRGGRIGPEPPLHRTAAVCEGPGSAGALKPDTLFPLLQLNCNSLEAGVIIAARFQPAA